MIEKEEYNNLELGKIYLYNKINPIYIESIEGEYDGANELKVHCMESSSVYINTEWNYYNSDTYELMNNDNIIEENLKRFDLLIEHLKTKGLI